MQTIFLNLYIVHEYLVEENVLTKLVIAIKIYCMFNPAAFLLVPDGEPYRSE